MEKTKNLKTQITDRIKVFQQQKKKFRNNPLQTEQPNPDTINLSVLAKKKLPEAVNLLKNVDIKAVRRMLEYVSGLEKLKADIEQVLESGNKIIISGCGASGRLAVALEFLWNYCFPEKKGMVTGFLGGGDNAMIKSIEGFEDFKEYGVKQLKLAGFKDGDLLIAASASGESPFVLATAEYAAESSVKPWFIHCNTNDSLKGRITDHVIYNKKVKSLGLYTGQMALTGSTRMQATTVLMLGIGLPLLGYNIKDELENFSEVLDKTDMTPLIDFIKNETEIYKNGEYVFYDIDEFYGVTVLTDTTERAPTFNLAPFENQLDNDFRPSWFYIVLRNAGEPAEAWNKLLGRKPRTLNWSEETSRERLLGFNFSRELINLRSSYAKPFHYYKIFRKDNKIKFSLRGCVAEFNVNGFTPLFEHLILKLLLNTSSTIMMGRLGYYEGNLMTSVYPSNSKLIDRSVRYIDFILKNRHGINLNYEKIADEMFEELYLLQPGESIVKRTIDKILNKNEINKQTDRDYLIKQASRPAGIDGRKIANKMFDSHAGLVKWAARKILTELKLKENVRVLDVGCGAGTAISLLNADLTEAEFSGIDYSPDMLELTKENNKSLLSDKRLEIYHASVDNLPFEDNYFDFAVGVETIYFWPDKINGLAEIKRVLKKNSAFAMINEAYNFEGLETFSEEMYKMSKNMEINSIEEYKSFFEKAGFHNISYGNRKDKAWLYMTGKA
ncbi:MAG: methyltransferase domain-containing protein [Victivallales bacterium]|nr:methyltransferase domain-containing protein [Victivallales bacterium]MCF7888800.1 methyltransferase domain-containing protein [Victivallales bacterium]